MAGHRRSTAQPTQRQSKAERRRAHMINRLGNAQTPAERLTAACDYARSTVANLDQRAANLLADELVRMLVDACDAAARAAGRREPGSRPPPVPVTGRDAANWSPTSATGSTPPSTPTTTRTPNPPPPPQCRPTRPGICLGRWPS